MIATFRHRRYARQALALLERERLALLTGDFPAMRQTSAALNRIGTALEGLATVRDPSLIHLLEQVRDAADRNGRIADASRRGLRTASRLRAEVGGSATNLGTYTGAGQRRDIVAPKTTRDRRT